VQLSDVHVVGERYGFRLESGRLGPRGNERFKRLLRQLDAIHASEPLDHIMLTGDMTDAGISSEWAEFLDDLASHPKLAKLVLMLPGNHDLNIVDRANPARMDLPMSPNRRLRKLRTMSAMDAVQGARVRVVDRERRRLGKTLAEVIKPHRKEIERFADSARSRFFTELPDLWAKIFPMVVPPDKPDGLGIILFDSNADTHFSFTNALGMISAEQIEAFNIVQEQYPEACWLIGLHHHLMEYPWAVKALSERIGTALINGNWVLRQLKPLAGYAVFMHGHRHIDWMGECAGFPIISAPSPVMGVTDDVNTAFYIHSLAIGPDGRLRLLEPERIVVKGEKTERAESARLQRASH
jgi:calcineurin-like phosphoesterase family protein